MTEIMLTHMGHPFDPRSKLENAAVYATGGLEVRNETLPLQPNRTLMADEYTWIIR